MTRTKKGFLKAGAIIGIVAAALIGILGMICFAGQTIVDRDFVVQTTFNCKENEYTTIENFDGSFTYKYVNENGITTELSSKDVDTIVSMAKSLLTTTGVYGVAMAIASVVFSILVLINACTEKCKNGYIITLLVLSLLTCNVLTAAFMIVALCLKDKQKQQEDVVVTAE